MSETYFVDCPHCGRRLEVRETTTEVQCEAGLVYLGTKCVDCDTRIDAAGVGAEAARADMARVLTRRIGTSPIQWRIVPRPGRTRRRFRR